jgi:RNA polymerase sigma factor (sigma-70 family)
MQASPAPMFPSHSVPDLVSLARDANADALSELYSRYGQPLMALAYRLTRSRADAEDVLHDVFLGLPEALSHYEERGAFDSWIKRVTARVALTKMRGRNRSREVSLDTAAAKPSRDASHLLGDLVAVQRAIDALPDKLRIVFVLREIEGYSHAEIAALLDISANTSEVRLHRAIKSLRVALGAQP